MKTYALIALMSLAALGHADPIHNDLSLDRVSTTASGGFEIAVSYKLQKAVLKAEKLDPGQPTTLQEGAFFATIRSVKSLSARDNVITVQLTAAGFEGTNGSRLTGLYILQMQQGNEYGISNPDQKPIFDSTANIERDLSFYIIGMTQPTLANCSEVDALRVLVAYQKKFPRRLLKMAMTDAEGGKFVANSGGGLCANLPDAENDVDISLREPALPVAKKAPATTVAPAAPATADAAKPAAPNKNATRNRYVVRNGKMIDTTTGRPATAAVETDDGEADDPEVTPPPNPGPSRTTRSRQAPTQRRQQRDPYQQPYSDPYGRDGYGGQQGYGGYGGQRGYGY